MPERGKLVQVRPKGPTLRFQFNPVSVVRTGGLARYDEITRPLRKSATEFAGQDLERITFTLIFEGYPSRSVEGDLATLRGMAKPLGSGKRGPLVKLVYGPLAENKLWTVSIDDQPDELRRRDLRRVRQDVVVTLLEWVEAEASLTSIEKHNEEHGGSHRSVVADGRTLAEIAADELGDPERWTEIAELNGIRDPRSVAVGTELFLPDA